MPGRRLGRLLDTPARVTLNETAFIAHSFRQYGASPSLLWSEPSCVPLPPSAAARESATAQAPTFPSHSIARCTANVALLVTGEFRDFLPPFKPHDRHWKDLTPAKVWSRLIEALVKPNGPADVFVHSWDTALARELVAQLPAPPCASVCEEYGETYAARVLARYPDFRMIKGFLRFNHSKETPHVVDFFYKRYVSLQLLTRFEEARGRRYLAVILTRPDVVVATATVPVLGFGGVDSLEPRSVYLHDSDHHHDSTDKDTTADPMARGQCGQMPNDWFAYGNRDVMGKYLSAFPSLPSIHREMRSTPGSCDYWRCHNYRYNHTFLNNGEAYLGFHLRRNQLHCIDVRHMKPPIHMALPSTRKRDWGPHTLGMG